MIRALAKVHRRRRIESGQGKSVTDLAAEEDVTDAYPPSAAAAQLLRRMGVCRLLPLTCLAPDIVEAVPDGR